jgi:hypothetical protein
MMIIGCDFHPRFQQIAFIDQETGEYGELRLSHPEEAESFTGLWWEGRCALVRRRRGTFVGFGS